MKNLKGIVFGFIAMVAMIGGVSAEESVACTNGYKASINNGGNVSCYSELTGAITAAKDGDTVQLATNVDLASSSITVNKNIVLDLNNHKITFKSTNKVDIQANGSLTIVGNGTITNTSSGSELINIVAGGTLATNGNVTLNQESSSKDVIKVTAANDSTTKTNITIGSATTVSGKQNGLVVYPTASSQPAKGVTVNMAGTWNTDKYVIKVNGNAAYTATDATVVNIENGTYTSSNNTALYASGYAIWNVNAGNITGNQAMQINSGKVTINGGNFKGTKAGTKTNGHANNGAAIAVLGAHEEGTYQDDKYIDLTINDGSFTSTDGYALTLDRVRDGKFAIDGGTFQSEDGKTALYINDYTFLDKHAGMISRGTFINGIVENVATSGSSYVTASSAVATLTKGTDFSTDEDGNIIVGNPSNGDDNTVTGDNIGGTTDSNEANPNTADVNLMTLVGTILVGLAGLAYTMKNRLFN